MTISIDRTSVMPEEFEEGHIVGGHCINRTDGSGGTTGIGLEAVHVPRVDTNGAELTVRRDNAVTVELTEDYARRLGLALIAATDGMAVGR